MKYSPTIGLEVHIELKTKSKMFCDCPNDSDEKNPNFNICPICLGHPGTLPVINEEAVKKTVKTGLALNCQIAELSKFDRKNYFYPDLPKGYQISQYDQPICSGGLLEIDGKKIKIRRVHLEEDTGKLLHPKGTDYSLVDFNRAGVPLMELVTEPDIDSAKEAKKFAEELHLLLRYLDVSSADMEKGQLRVEVNISLRPLSLNSEVKEKKLGTKVEIKNLNSFRSVEKSIDYEIKRQTEILDKNEKIIQETRGWDDVEEKTVSQRKKEEAHDYRYFPEPDLPPLHFSKEFVQEIKCQLPELPAVKRNSFKEKYKLSDKETEIFISDRSLGEYFEKVVSQFDVNFSKEKLFASIKLAANYLISDLQGLLKGSSINSHNFLIKPGDFAKFINLIQNGEISSKIAKTVLLEMFKTGADPLKMVEERGLAQVSNQNEIEAVAKEVVSENPRTIEDYKKGKENAFQFLIGQIMAKTKGKANPQIAGEALKEILTKLK